MKYIPLNPVLYQWLNTNTDPGAELTPLCLWQTEKVLMWVVGDPWEGVAVDPREMQDGSKNGRKD